MKFGRLASIVAAVFLPVSCAVLSPRFAKDEPKPSLTAEYRPLGTIRTPVVPCSVAGPSGRRMVVYLPQGYYSDSTSRYPVLYIFHGAKGTELSWILDGHILKNADSLVTAGLMRESIIVMPNMNYYKDDEDYADSRFKAAFESFFEIDGAVESAFVRDVVEYVDSHYRTLPYKSGRAIAGLSIGGLQAINISATHPDMFDYVGLFSPMSYSVIMCGDHSSFFSHLRRRQEVQFRNPPRIYALYIGKNDIFHGQTSNYCRRLSRNGCLYEYYVSGGGHDWYNWEPYSVLFMQKLWK